MICDNCFEDFKNDFLGKEKVEEGIVFLCSDCKEKINKLSVDRGENEDEIE